MMSTRLSGLMRGAALIAASLAVGALGMWFALGRNRPASPTPAPSAPTAAATPATIPDGEGVYISPERQQLIGVRTAKVTRQALESTIRTVGVIAYDETRVAEIHTKITGWVEDVTVDFVGKQIRKGQPLFRIYSPDLVATQREYLLALKADRQLSASAIPETRDGARSLLEATRQRLRLWDITDAQIDALAASGQPQRTLTVYSPSTGIVLERNAFSGQYLTPEMAAFKIADLSTLWVMGQVFEYELGRIRLGQRVAIELPYGQGAKALNGRITFIYPDVDPATRRAKVRIELPNPGLDLKPGSFVTVLVNLGGGDQLVVPQEAVIDTGDAQYVLLARPGGFFEPRPVKVGPASGQLYPVFSGLEAGDLVVTSAQFLIDSETNLQAAMQSMVGHGHAADAATAPSAAPTPPLAVTPAAALAIDFSSTPTPARVGANTFAVTVRDAGGRPVTGALVAVALFMPAMPSMGMPAIKSAATLTDAGDGVYRGSADMAIPGRWDVTIVISKDGQRLGGKRLGLVVR